VLPPVVDRTLSEFVGAARATLGDDLCSIVLYGSAAEGALRPASDVNVIVVMRRFDAERIEALREPYRTAHAAVGLAVMYLLESEVAAAAESFAVKFADILERRRVLHGPDPFATLRVPRGARVARLRQVLLNLVLRLRESWVRVGHHEDQLAAAVASTAGPLRSAAATLLDLEGMRAPSPKEALARVARAEWGDDAMRVLSRVSAAREGRLDDPSAVGPTLLALIDLAERMHARAMRLGEGR
jgi:predicted nucleotidyltransferase